MPELKKYKMFINGEWVDSESKKTFKSLNPENNEPWAEAPEANEKDVDKAVGLVCSHAETTPGGVHSIASMKYFDEYRREAGEWRFSKRTINMLYYVPVKEYADSLTRLNRVFMGGDWHPADFPESRETYQDFNAKYVE